MQIIEIQKKIIAIIYIYILGSCFNKTMINNSCKDKKNMHHHKERHKEKEQGD